MHHAWLGRRDGAARQVEAQVCVGVTGGALIDTATLLTEAASRNGGLARRRAGPMTTARIAANAGRAALRLRLQLTAHAAGAAVVARFAATHHPVTARRAGEAHAGRAATWRRAYAWRLAHRAIRQSERAVCLRPALCSHRRGTGWRRCVRR